MVSINFHIKIKPGMNLEFMQSIGSIIIEIRKLEGCIGIDFKQDPHDKDRFSLLLNGNNRKFIEKLLESEEYNFLEGAITVLCKIPTIEVTIGNRTMRTDPEKNGNTSLKKRIMSELEHNHHIRK
jgi:quinol monooxygenase YgiN